jgi:hypothetical protein
MPVARYVNETWTITKADETALGLSERKVLSIIFRAVSGKGQWRRRWNVEL